MLQGKVALYAVTMLKMERNDKDLPRGALSVERLCGASGCASLNQPKELNIILTYSFFPPFPFLSSVHSLSLNT